MPRWANNVHELHSKYNLSLGDENVCNITYDTWKRMVNDQIKRVAFPSLAKMCSTSSSSLSTSISIIFNF